ncbi:hypothetical protein FGIG_12399 [Fasciola gigantica]|uniref:Uncharacterized protein n=1 Tax=Fasciola gigantica TaxID=46835 RepID=A0A504YU31_FASGI|nr:hypothetical protein FGIG_12399 [Fasciola gigantica]
MYSSGQLTLEKHYSGFNGPNLLYGHLEIIVSDKSKIFHSRRNFCWIISSLNLYYLTVSKELDEIRQRWMTASQMNESLTEKQKRLAEDIAHEKSLTQRLRSESHDTDSNHTVTVQKLQVENYKLSKNMTAIQEELQAAHEER